MKKRIVTIVVAIVTCMSTVFASGCSSYLFNPKYPMFSPTFENRKYVLPDRNELYDKISKINELVKLSGKKDEIFSLRLDLLYSLYEASTSRTLAQIYYDQNTQSEENKKRYEEINDFMNSFSNDVREVEKTILRSDYKADLVKLVGQEYADQMLASQTKSETLLQLESKETTLIADYSLYYGKKNEEKLAETYANLVKTRNAIAKEYKNADGVSYTNYLDYAYEQSFGRDYTPDEAASTRKEILTNILPLYENANEKMDQIIEKKKQTDNYHLTTLSTAKLKEYVSYVIDNTASSMKPSWDYMMNKNLYDFDVSSTKANTSYVSDFIAYGDGFMFVNTDGVLEYDLPTVIHEFGHYNAIFNEDEEKTGSGAPNYDLAETHSQCFELLALPATKTLFEMKGHDIEFYLTNKTLEFLWALLSNCAFDEFEYEIYKTPEDKLTAEYFKDTFSKVKQKYIPDSSHSYYDVPHLFQVPGYCISYTVSLLFSTEIASGENPVETYREVVSYGYNHYLSEVYEPLKLSNPLSAESVKNAAKYYENLLSLNV